MGLFGNRKEEVQVVSYEKDGQTHEDNIVTESIKTEHLADTIGDIYLIDFENVHDEGLRGIEALSPEDKVVVFYGNLNKMISLDTHLLVIFALIMILCRSMIKSVKR